MLSHKIRGHISCGDTCAMFIVWCLWDAGASYRRLAWLPKADLLSERPGLTRAYMKKVADGRAPPLVTGTEDGVCPEWRTAERVFDVQVDHKGRKQYLVKWSMLGYSESTWEKAEDLTSDQVLHLLYLLLDDMAHKQM